VLRRRYEIQRQGLTRSKGHKDVQNFNFLFLKQLNYRHKNEKYKKISGNVEIRNARKIYVIKLS
jgi:hypothetical protein